MMTCDELVQGPLDAIPQYTTPGGPNAYMLTDYKFWTGGFFPGSLWILVERMRLLKDSAPYSEDTIVGLAQRWEEPLKQIAYPASDHDQGFRFMSTFGREWDLLKTQSSKEMVLSAAKGLAERFVDKVGCIRSWSQIDSPKGFFSGAEQDNHCLVIIDNMMNLNLLFTASALTGDTKYREIAEKHAETSMRAHVRPDFGTWHVVNFDPLTGEIKERFAHQGWKDDSTWSRGQAWGLYGYAQCAQWTGRDDFLQTACGMTDKFLSLLPEDGVPHWDFDHPRPTPRDASAGIIAASGLLKLFRLLREKDPSKADAYLTRAFKLVKDTISLCSTPSATMNSNGTVDFGVEGWETILKHSTINGNRHAKPVPRMDHGLSYADYYLLEFGNEALKLKRDLSA